MNVLYEDNHLLVVDKPAGLLVQGGDRDTAGADDHLVARVAAWLKDKYAKPGNVYVGLVHRLDRNTSGLVVLAKTSKAAQRLSRDFAAHAVDKRYLAVVSGHTPDSASFEDHLAPSADHGSQLAPPGSPGARPARLELRTLARTPAATGAPGASLVEVRLLTGRKHQIRVQLAAHGHPLFGDRRYAPPEVAGRFSRPALHAWRITLAHPVRRDELRWEAALPADFSELLLRLGLRVTDPEKNPA